MSKEAFVYKWTNQDNGKVYIGYHKGNPDDDYISSSSNKEFWNDYWNKKSMFTKEILDQGTKQQMIELEHKLLKDNNAKDNDQFYNKHNGGIMPKRNSINFDLVKEISDKIDRREYPILVQEVEDVFNYDRKQVRGVQILPKNVQRIAERISLQSEEENEERISPIILVDDVDGKPLIIDGNHTINALERLNVVTCKVMVVPYSEFERSEDNLCQLGLLRNVGTITKGENHNEDLKRTLKEYMEDDIDIECRSFKESFANQMQLKTMSVAKLVQSVLTDVEIQTTNFIIYTHEQLEEKKIKLEEQNPEHIVHYCQTPRMDENGSGALLRKMFKADKDKGILIGYHPKPSTVNRYNSTYLVEQMFDFCGKKVQVYILPAYDI